MSSLGMLEKPCLSFALMGNTMYRLQSFALSTCHCRTQDVLVLSVFTCFEQKDSNFKN